MQAQRFTVAQLGARRHYAVPRLFHAEGRLGYLHTDICGVKGLPGLAVGLVPTRFRRGGLKRLADRVPHGIPTSLVRCHDWVGLMNSLRRRGPLSPDQTARVDHECRRAFAVAVSGSPLGSCDAVYTFDGAALEILEAAHRKGLSGVVDQCIPAREEVIRIVREEEERFPGVGASNISDPENLIARREKEEWEASDVIVCGSEFVRETIATVGGPVGKVLVVPSGVEAGPALKVKRSPPEGRPLRVLFVGEVGLRKGAHYLAEAARAMSPSEAEFRLVGSIQLQPSYLSRLPGNVTLMGPVPRSEIRKQYDWADIFCFPSLCEGAALVTYEALSRGLPVVTTRMAGSVVEDGVDGFIIPPRNSEAIVSALHRYAAGGLDQEVAVTFAGNPVYSMEAYGRRLLAGLDERLGPK